MTRILLENCTILDGRAPEPRPDRHVLIDGGRLLEVADGPIRDPEAQSIDLRIDLRGRTLMPGLIDAHVHANATSLDLARIDREPASLTAAKARHILEGMLRRGFTTVRDAAGADWGLALAAEQGLIEAPRIFHSGRALSQTGGHGDFRPRTVESCACCSAGASFAVIADGVPAVQQAAREELRRGATQIKIMASGGIASPTDPIWNLQYSDDEIRAAVWEARSWRTYVMAHAYTPEAIGRAVRLGVRSIEHGNLIDADTAELMAAEDAFLVPTLVTYEALHREGATWGLPQASLDKVKDVREAGLRSLELARAAGVKIGFGTDLLGETHHYQSLEFSIRAEAMPPFEVIRSATIVNAELLNQTGELGVVTAGARADLIAVDGNPLDDLNLLQEQGKHLPLIVKDGRIVKNELAPA